MSWETVEEERILADFFALSLHLPGQTSSSQQCNVRCHRAGARQALRGTFRILDIGCFDARNDYAAPSLGNPCHDINGAGRRKIPRPAVAGLRMTSGGS